MNALGETVRRLRIHRSLFDEAAKGDLEMLCRAAETVVQLEIPASSVDVVAPEQACDPAPGPHAFRSARRQRQPRCGLSVLLDLLLDAGLGLLLGRRLVGWLLLGLLRGLLLPPLTLG